MRDRASGKKRNQKNRRPKPAPPSSFEGQNLEETKARLVNGLYNYDGGVMMTTSEILDFSEGADST